MLSKAGNIPADLNLLNLSRFSYKGVQHHSPIRGAKNWNCNVIGRKRFCGLKRRFGS